MKKTKKPLSTGRKLLIVLTVLALVIGAVYLGYHLMHFTFYNEYRRYLTEPVMEEATELSLGKDKLEGYKDYRLVTQSDVLALYINDETTDVAVLDKRSGHITFAVPPMAEEDPVANKVNRDYLRSHVIVNYYNAARTEGIYDSWSMSVEREQVTLEAIENGVRVTYEMGDFSKSMGTVPQYMSEEKFAELSALLNEEDAAAFGRYYSTNSDVSGMRQLLKTARNNRNVQAKLQAMLDTAGFTEEDYVEQMALAGSNVSVPISFVVAVEYRLVGDYVEVSVPVDAIEERGGAAIYRIQLLRSFGAAGTDEEGYMVVPNGDGSLIYLNNGKTNATNYNQYIYGIDPLAADYTVVESASNASMALYGIHTQDATILATIEDGAPLASVTAGISGKVNSYNFVYTSFVIRGSETLEMFGTTGNEATLPIIEPDPYRAQLTVRYSFLDEDHSGYSGMARYLRERLTQEGVLERKTEEEELKFYYDIIAGVEMTEFFLGKQYMGLTAMTTFEEAGQISRQLTDLGIRNQVMNLQGWFNGGYYHDAPNHIFTTRKLGGRKGLESLNALMEQQGGTLYADVAFQKVSFESEGIWFNYQAESAKYYGSGYVASFGQVNPANFRQTASLGYHETMYDLISPKFLVRHVNTFAEKFADYEVSGISLRDLGNTLHSDKKRTNIINRAQALEVVLGTLDTLEGSGKNLMFSAANDYAWGYSSDILNLPLGDNEYILVDEDIPLYEMIIHGAIDYCGNVYNLSDSKDARVRILNMVEYGAAPHFVFTWEEATEMKYSGMNSSYATSFTTWAGTAAEVYREVSERLNAVTNAVILSHEILPNGLRHVVYDNGTEFFVNYSDRTLSAGSLQVPAMGYAVK